MLLSIKTASNMANKMFISARSGAVLTKYLFEPKPLPGPLYTCHKMTGILREICHAGGLLQFEGKLLLVPKKLGYSATRIG